MTTQQNDTAALTDEQLDAVSGGPHYHSWRVGFRSIASIPRFRMGYILKGNYVGVVNEDGPVW